MGSNVSSPLHIVILNGSESCTHARTHTERERERRRRREGEVEIRQR
jgi:hypothetical protein